MTDNPSPEDLENAIRRFAATGSDGTGIAPAGNQDAFERVTAFWNGLDAANANAELQALRAETLSRYPLGSRPRAGARWRSAGYIGLAATAVAAVGLGSVSWWSHRAPPATTAIAAVDRILANGRGAPRTVALGDGTQVTLDAQSAIRVAAGSGDRAVTLTSGRAFFTVVHDAAHPFAVRLAGATVTDVGTRFEAGFVPDGASIVLLDGKVQVTGPGTDSISMTPGSRLSLRGGTWAITHVDAMRYTQWRDGMLNVDDQPIGEVVDKLNRYLPTPLVLRDSAAASMRISGTFRLNDGQALQAALTAIGQRDLVRESKAPATLGRRATP